MVEPQLAHHRDVTKSSEEHADNDGIQDDANIVEFSDSGDEAGTSSAKGKRPDWTGPEKSNV